MKRNLFLFTSFAVSYGTAIQASTLQTKIESSSDKPNIVLIVVDDMGYGDFGCYGNKNHKTPNIDRLAAEGARLTDFHTNGVLSSPTRAALMTGRYQQYNGIEGVVTAANHRDCGGLSTDAPTIAKIVRNGGYQTAIFGKWHLGYAPRFNPIHHGFDEFIGYVAGNVDYFTHIDQAGFEDWWKNDNKHPEEGYTTDIITNHALQYINTHTDKPFFLYIPYEACHSPMQGPGDKPQRIMVDGKMKTIKSSRRDFSTIYKEMVESLDYNVGRIMQTLKEKGLDDNTLVLFFSDNGGSRFSCNAPWSGGKGSLLEGGHRVSSLARFPGHIKPGTVSAETIITMDVMPTICEVAGISLNGTKHDGVSYWKTLTENRKMPERSLFWRTASGITVRKDNWKLTTDRDYTNPVLIDLESDPKEKSNVAEANPIILQQLLKEIKEWDKNFVNIKQFT